MNPTPTTTAKDNKNGSHAHTPAPEKKVETKTEAKTETATGASEEETKREAAKVYLVTGSTMEFKNIAECEKYLNGSADAPKDFTVIKGKKIEKKQKVSLR